MPAWKDVIFIDLGQLGQGHLRSPKVEPFDFEILLLICGGRSRIGGAALNGAARKRGAKMHTLLDFTCEV